LEGGTYINEMKFWIVEEIGMFSHLYLKLPPVVGCEIKEEENHKDTS